MTAWIAWSLLTSALVAIAAASLERVAGYVGMPRRLVVITAMVVITATPLALALRVAPPSPAPSLATARPDVREVQADGVAAASPDSRIDQTSIAARWRVVLTRWTGIAPGVDRWMLRAWIAASVVLLILFLRSLIGLARRRSRWDNEETAIGPVFVARDDGPAVVGFLRPRVVLPSWALAEDRATLAVLLRHEAEHIRAGDTRVLILAELALVAFPWNAPLWWLANRLRVAIEIDCDARVIRATGDALGYGSVLLAVGDRHAVAMPFAAPLTEHRLNLEERIKAMTTLPPRHPIVSSLPLMAIAVGVVATAGWTPRPVSLRSAFTEVPTHAAAPQSPSRRNPKPLAGNPAPRFPESLRAPGTDGHIVIAFLTDAHGVPDTSSVTIVEATNDLFVDAVRRVLQSWRFDSGGSVRLLFRFLTADVEDNERAGQPQPAYMQGATSLMPVIIVAIPLQPSISPARRETGARDTTLDGVGYSFRKQSGLGFFIDGKQINRSAPVFSEIIRAAPGFRVGPTGDGHSFAISDAHDRPNSCVNVFVDGMLWQQTTPGDIDEHLRPDQVVAVEAYNASSTPRQFTAGDSGCATIIAWTRARVRPA